MCETAAVHVRVRFLVDGREVDGREVDGQGRLMAEGKLMARRLMPKRV